MTATMPPGLFAVCDDTGSQVRARVYSEQSPDEGDYLWETKPIPYMREDDAARAAEIALGAARVWAEGYAADSVPAEPVGLRAVSGEIEASEPEPLRMRVPPEPERSDRPGPGYWGLRATVDLLRARVVALELRMGAAETMRGVDRVAASIGASRAACPGCGGVAGGHLRCDCGAGAWDLQLADEGGL